MWLLRLRGEDSAGQPIRPEPTFEEVSAALARNTSAYVTVVREGMRAEAR